MRKGSDTVESAPGSLTARFTERPVAEILEERRKLVSKMRSWVLFGVLIGLLFLIPYASTGQALALLASIFISLLIALLGLLANSGASPELSADTIFSSWIPFRAVLFGNEVGAMKVEQIVCAEHLLSGEWAHVRVVSESGDTARFVGKGKDNRLEAVLEWLNQNGIEVHEARLDPNWRGIRLIRPPPSRHMLK